LQFSLREKRLRVFHLRAEEFTKTPVVVCGNEVRRNVPHMDELVVETHDPVVGVDDQNPISSGLQRGPDKRQGMCELGLGTSALGDFSLQLRGALSDS
jgi:hypothetical protein